MVIKLSSIYRSHLVITKVFRDALKHLSLSEKMLLKREIAIFYTFIHSKIIDEIISKKI